jgi:drug/metabolite transporter (DMT)-like permease
MLFFFALTLIPAICFAFGNILAKQGLSTVAKTWSLKTPWLFIKQVFQNKYWWAGIALSGLANLGYYLAMALYDISLVQPMMALNPVLTALFGFWFLKEYLTKRILFAIFFVFIGLLLSASHAGESSSLQNISGLWIFASLFIIIAILFKFFHSQTESTDAFIMGTGYGVSAAFYKSIAISFTDSLSAENIILLLTDTRVLGFMSTYTIAFLYSQIAFTRGRALFIIPFSAALGSAIPILAGTFVFSETLSIEKSISILFVLFGSALFIVRRPRKTL